jgi:hypothetical protein
MSNLSNANTNPQINSIAYKHSPVSNARIKLSGNTTTAPFNITTGGVLIHTCADYCVDEVYLWVSNYSSANVLLTVEIGGNGSFSDASKTFEIEVTKEEGLIQIYPGVPHQNLTIYAKAASNNALNIFGYAQRHYRISLSDPELGFDGSE